jgi:hypothetical protein
MHEGREREEVMTTSPCKYCGRALLWAVDGEGKRIPLDAVAPVYTVDDIPDNKAPLARRANGKDLKSGDSFVTHFATCKKLPPKEVKA